MRLYSPHSPSPFFSSFIEESPAVAVDADSGPTPEQSTPSESEAGPGSDTNDVKDTSAEPINQGRPTMPVAVGRMKERRKLLQASFGSDTNGFIRIVNTHRKNPDALNNEPKMRGDESSVLTEPRRHSSRDDSSSYTQSHTHDTHANHGELELQKLAPSSSSSSSLSSLSSSTRNLKEKKGSSTSSKASAKKPVKSATKTDDGTSTDMNEILDHFESVDGEKPERCNILLCYVVLCYFVLCCAVLCCAVLCCAVLCYVGLCFLFYSLFL